MSIINVGDKLINRYLLPIGEDFCLIDTGYKWSYKKFLQSLIKQNILIDNIKYLILTHIHSDHAGFAKQLINDYPNIQIIYNEKGKARLEAGKNNMDVYVPSLTSLFSSYASVIFVQTLQSFPAVSAANAINYSDQPLQEYGIELVPFSGHTNADLGIIFQDKLFCGDICMNGFPSTKRFPLWLENKFELIKSWEKIIAMDNVQTIYPAHGKPFDKSQLTKYIEFWRSKGVYKLFKKKKYLV